MYLGYGYHKVSVLVVVLTYDMSTLNRYYQKRKNYNAASGWGPASMAKRARTRTYSFRKMALGRTQSRRGYPNKKQSTMIFRSIKDTDFLPRNFYNTMRYSEDWVDTTAGGVIDYVYNMNYLYDPYNAAGGQVVAGWSTMVALYGKYKVLSAELVCTVVNNDVDDPITVTLNNNVTSTAITTVYDASKPESKSIVVANQAGQGVVSTYVNAKYVLGGDYTDATATCATTSAPGAPTYTHVTLRNVSGNALNCFIKVDIRYKVHWFSRTAVTT